MVFLNLNRARPALAARLPRLVAEIGPDSTAIAGSAANVRWLTGLAGVAHSYYNRGALIALLGAAAECHVVAPASELGWICEAYDPDLVHPHGTFVYRGDTTLVGTAPDRRPRAARTPPEALLAALAELSDATRLIHDGHIPADTLQALARVRPDLIIVADPEAFLRARSVKDAYEIDCLRRANRACEEGIMAALAAAKVGMTELEMLRVLRGTMVEHDAHPLLSAVGFSERGALVDMPVTDRALKLGEVIRFDIGCTVEGYHADMSRTAAFGPVDGDLKQLHAGLVEAEKAAIASAKPGIHASALFETAVSTARAAGVTDYDRTHCGHGIGLEIYEPPSVSAASSTVLHAGMTLCIETPYYLLGRAGLQIEDAILVTDSGAERLGQLPQRLLTAG